MAITLVGELLHKHIVVVTHPKADRGELDTFVGRASYLLEDRLGSGASHVGHAVRAQDDPVDGTPTLVAPRQVVRQPQTFFGVGGAAGPQPPDRSPNGLFVACGLEQNLSP